MKCEDALCIYYENAHCTLTEIGINSQTMCDSCICVSFDESEIKPKRQRLLRILNDCAKEQ